MNEKIIYCMAIFVGLGFAAWCAGVAWVTRPSKARWVGNEKTDREKLHCCDQSLMIVERLSKYLVSARCVVCGKLTMLL